MPPPVLFGVSIDPVWVDPQAPVRLARDIDRTDLDLVTIQDHPYQQTFYDTWTLIAYLAGMTTRVSFVPTVSNLPLRPPAVLAKSAASLDLLTGGRVQLGLGAGAFWEAIAGMGGPKRDPKEALDALAEAIEVIRLMWSGQHAVRFDGAYYRLTDVDPGPAPGSGLGIWLGAYGPRALRLTGAKADGWIPSLSYLGLDRLGDAVARVESAARSAGRDPASIRKIYNVMGVIGGRNGGPFQGSVEQWVDQLVDLVERFGINGFVYWPDQDHYRQLALFNEEVVPAARQVLAQ